VHSQASDDAFQVCPTGARRNGAERLVSKQQQPESIAVAAKQLSGNRGELNRSIALQAFTGSPIYGSADVDHQPHVKRTLYLGFSDKWHVGSGSQIPVDSAYVVTRLIGAHTGEFHSSADQA
jgi:hypothetical protein